ncbi:MAG: hypothetical protein ACTSQG_05825 [Promethearchaeota archaeon]
MKLYRYYQKTSKSKWEKGPYNIIPKGYRFMTILAKTENGLFYGPLYFDFDKKPEKETETLKEFAKRIDDVLDEIRKMFSYMETNYNLNLNHVQAWFTGSAGFHIVIPPQILGVEPHKHLPLIFKKIVEEEFPVSRYKYIDRSVYSEGKGRMWRVANIKRSNGFYKIPVYVSEIMSMGGRFFIDKAKNKRNIKIDKEWILNPEFSAIYNNSRIIVETESFFIENQIEGSKEIPQDYIAPCIEKIAKRKKRIQGKNYNEISLILADYFANNGMFQQKIIEYLKEFFRDYPSNSYPTPKDRQKEFEKKLRFIKRNKEQWSCGYARFLKVCDKCRLEGHVTEEEEQGNIKGDFPMPSEYLNPYDNTFHLENMPFIPDYKKENDLKKYEPIEPITVNDIMATIERWYKNYDYDLIKLILAVIAAHFFEGPPVWLLIRGAPSSGKTEFINALNALPFTVDASDLTPRTLFSSDVNMENKKKKTAAWIATLNHKIMLFRDFTNTINSKNPNDRKEILSQLRGIYDGKFTRRVGKKGLTISWEGKIGMIGAATILYDELTIIEGEQFGERLLTYKLKTDPDFNIDFLEEMMGMEEERKYEMQKAFISFFHDFKVPKVNEIKITSEQRKKISILQQLIARGRAPVKRARQGHIIINLPEIERAPRIEKQLIMILKGLAVIHGRDYANDEDFKIICKIALSNISNLRWEIIKFLWNEYETGTDPRIIKLQYIADNLGYPKSTINYHIEELVTQPIHLVNRIALSWEEDPDKGTNAPVYCYELSYDCINMLKIIPKDIIEKY